MRPPRFLTDEDFNNDIVEGAYRKAPGLEVVAVRDTHVAGRPDAEVLQFAEEQGLLLLTHDENTMTRYAYERLAAGLSFPGVFIVHQWMPVATAIENVLLLWGAGDADEWRDRVVFFPL